MRTLLLHFFDTSNKKHDAILRNLVKGAESNGNEVTVFDAQHDNVESLHLAIYEYIAVAATSPKFIGAKIPKKLVEILSSASSINGKKGCVVVIKFGLSSGKMVHIIMKELESHGMVLDYFDVIENIDHSVAVGKKIG
ncbi:MAG: hypothetical protein GX297_05875 [Treponema sp.]|jgi:flavorubredoxin|nr:hypothetical protein [Treponema sp.]